MNKFAYLIVIFAALAINTSAQKKSTASIDPSKDVRQAFDRLIDGIKQVDAGKVAGTYEKSDRLLIFNNNGSATIGWENVKANVEASYAKVSNVSIEVTGVRVEMLGKTAAYVSCKWKQTQESDGKLESASGRMTLVFKLIGKEWKIVHRHTSPDNPGPTRPVFPSERTDQ
jgi:ketosteroid isomerase-like protein